MIVVDENWRVVRGNVFCVVKPVDDDQNISTQTHSKHKQKHISLIAGLQRDKSYHAI